jgi:hypothetical protein
MEVAERIGLQVAGKVALPVLAWLGTRVIRVVSLGGGGDHVVGPVQGVLLATASVGTVILVAAKPEESLDFVLRGIANTANAAGKVLGVVADQIRALEKVDLENLLNTPFQYFDTPAGGLAEQKLAQLAIAPLLPKDYTLDNFPYFLKTKKPKPSINNEEVDPYLEAYHALGIDIVPMILDQHQLPQLPLVRQIYLQQIRQFHPDKSTNRDANLQASTLNDSYAKIKALMNSPDDQFDVIRPVLQYFHKGTYPATPYIILFFAGGFLTLLLLK